MKNIVLSGGGTLGSVTPLLGLKEQDNDNNFIWIGTRFGPEQRLINKYGIDFISIFSGKIRRYISLKNITDIFKIVIGFCQSIYFLKRKQIDLCITAGGFVSVPVHVAAWILGIPTWVHQQDVEPGLANRLMAKFADKVTVSLESSQKKFNRETDWIGNFVRDNITKASKKKALSFFNLKQKKPTILALGGGTGARTINELIANSVPILIDSFQFIHIAGTDRKKDYLRKLGENYGSYKLYELLKRMGYAYSASDLVICRAGFATLTELSVLKKKALLIPKPGHQEQNAEIFTEIKGVKKLTEPIKKEDFIRFIKSLDSLDIKPDYENVLPIVEKGTTGKIVNKLLT